MNKNISNSPEELLCPDEWWDGV